MAFTNKTTWKIFLKCFLRESYKKYLFWANMQKFVKWCIKSWRQYVQLGRFFLYKICKHPFSKGGLSCPSDITVSFFPQVALVFLRWKEYPCCHSTIRLDIQKPEKNLARSCEDVAYTYSSVLNKILAISWDLKPQFPYQNITKTSDITKKGLLLARSYTTIVFKEGTNSFLVSSLNLFENLRSKRYGIQNFGVHMCDFFFSSVTTFFI